MKAVDKTVVVILALLICIMTLAVSGSISGNDAMLVITAITGYVLRETTAINRSIHQNGGNITIPSGPGTVSVQKTESEVKP